MLLKHFQPLTQLCKRNLTPAPSINQLTDDIPGPESADRDKRGSKLCHLACFCESETRAPHLNEEHHPINTKWKSMLHFPEI